MIKLPKLFRPWDWFKSEERKQIKELYDMYSPLASLLKNNTQSDNPSTKAFKSMRYLGGNLIVVLNDGIILTKNKATKEDLDTALKLSTEEQIIDFFTDSEVKRTVLKTVEIESPEERQLVKDNLHALRNHPDFEIIGDDIYLTGVKLAMPATVSGSFIELVEKIALARNRKQDTKELEDYYLALKMFWLQLAVNPIPQSRLDLLGFVKRNDVKITKNGNLILYRRIVSTKQRPDKKLVAAISQFYTKVKKNKKSPKNYELVDKDGQYLCVKAQEDYDVDTVSIGNLYQLYKDLPNMEENIYTSSHSNKVTIKIGGIYQIPENEIDLNNGICASGGLHAACKDYDYSGFGDTPVVVLVSPSKAITVPVGDGGKLRTTEMFIACVNNTSHGKHFAEDSLSVFDEEYSNYTLGTLEAVVKNKSFEPLEIKGKKPAVQLADIEQIINHVKNRVVNSPV